MGRSCTATSKVRGIERSRGTVRLILDVSVLAPPLRVMEGLDSDVT